MNTVLSSYGQLCGCPEILKKSCKFFCRGLDIRVPQIVITDMRHIQPGQQFAEAGGNPVCRLGRTVVFRHNKVIIIEGLSLLCCRLLLCGFSSSPMESPLFPWNRGI